MTDKLPKVFTVDARNWIRGGKFVNGDGGVLLSNKGKMCCLGFLGEACGVERKDMLKVCMPYSVVDKIKYPNFSSFDPQGFVSTNDSIQISDEERVVKLRELFKKKGITVRFKNLPKGRAFTGKPRFR